MNQKFAMAIHGGAGTLDKTGMTDKLKQDYKKGLEMAINAGLAVLRQGGLAIAAVEEAVVSLENNPLFNAGKGAVLTSERKHEMDAAIMDGRDLTAGAVAGISGLKNPIRLARRVLNSSQYVFLCGPGAIEFARQQELEFGDEDYFRTKEREEELEKEQKEEKRKQEKEQRKLKEDEQHKLQGDEQHMSQRNEQYKSQRNEQYKSQRNEQYKSQENELHNLQRNEQHKLQEKEQQNLQRNEQHKLQEKEQQNLQENEQHKFHGNDESQHDTSGFNPDMKNDTGNREGDATASKVKKFGTVGAVALDQNGNLAAATSTGGLSNKKFGRVGDTPLIGCGTYANNDTCAVSCTGEGEEFIRAVVAYDVSCLMEYKGLSLQEACQQAMKGKIGRVKGSGGLIAVDRLGSVEMPFNTEGMYRASFCGKGKLQISIFEE